VLECNEDCVWQSQPAQSLKPAHRKYKRSWAQSVHLSKVDCCQGLAASGQQSLLEEGSFCNQLRCSSSAGPLQAQRVQSSESAVFDHGCAQQADCCPREGHGRHDLCESCHSDSSHRACVAQGCHKGSSPLAGRNREQTSLLG
jgi:hypothetical protein